MNYKKLLTFILALCMITLGFYYVNGQKDKASSNAQKARAASSNHKVKAASPSIEKTHIVKKGESISDVAKLYGIPIERLIQANQDRKNAAKPGETLLIPKATIKDSDKELLSRLVHAEAKGEPYQGKVAVAAVVLNRINSDQFPDTVPEVIYQENQFSPVADGSIKKPAGKEAKQAVNEAIAIQSQTEKALYFYNPSISKSKWMRQLKIVKIIGRHHFAI